MARKGREPLTEAPPSVASSDGDSSDEESSDDEQQQPQQPAPPQHSSSSNSEEEEDPEEEEEEEEEEDEEEEENPISNSIPTPTPPPKKPTSTITPTAAASSATKPAIAALAAKRSAPPAAASAAKKPKKENNNNNKETDSLSSKKPVLFQRLWSEEDEVLLLKGMIEYKERKGSDPMSEPDGFLNFVKKSLHVADVKKDQIVNKVRRMKKKFQNARASGRKIGGNSKNTHEVKVFELSSGIWGDEEEEEKKGKTVKENGSVAMEKKKGLVEEKKENVGGEWVIEQCEGGKGGGSVEELAKFELGNVGVIKDGLRMIGEEKRRELEEEWQEVQIAEMELLSRKLELYQKMTRRVLNALKSSNN